jgi:hypothetical protein
VKAWGNKFGYRRLPEMMDDIAIVLSTTGAILRNGSTAVN